MWIRINGFGYRGAYGIRVWGLKCMDICRNLKLAASGLARSGDLDTGFLALLSGIGS